MATTEQIMQLLVSTREDVLGKLDESQLARSQFSRDVIPAQNSSFTAKKESATVQRARIINETNIVADTLSSKFPWMYQKPADEKGDTKIVKRAEDQLEVAKETEKETKSSGSKLGRIIGLLAAAGTLFVLFKDEIIKGFKFVVSNFGTIIKFLGEKIFNVMKWLWDKMWPILKPLAEKIWAGLKWLGGWIWDGLKSVGNFLGAVFDNVKTFLGDKLSAVGQMIKVGMDYLGAAFKKHLKVGLLFLATQILRLPILIAAKIGKGISHVLTAPIKGILYLIGKIPGKIGRGARELSSDMEVGRDAVFDFLDGPNMDTTYNYFNKKYVEKHGDPAGHLTSDRMSNAMEKFSGPSDLKPLPSLDIKAPSLDTLKSKFSTSTSSSRAAVSKFENKIIAGRKALEEAFGGAKPLTGLKPTSAPGKKTDDILLTQEEILRRIEQNTRGGVGGGTTVVSNGQRGSSTNAKGNNSIAPNLNPGTGGSKKLDSRGNYVRSPYSVTPNSLIT